MVPSPSQNRVTIRRSPKSIGLGLLLVLTLLSSLLTAFFAPPNQAQALTNTTLNFQARLQTSSGAIVPDGYYNVEFKLYSAASGGTALWTETYYDTNGVTAGNDFRIRVQNGYLTTSLGSLTAFPTTINWDQQLWITMNIGGSTQTATPTYDGEMNPRLQLTGVPYAFRAGDSATLGGIASSGFIQNTTTPQAASNFNISGNGTIGGNLSVSGNANLIKTTTNSTTAFQIQNASSAPVVNVDTVNQQLSIRSANASTSALSILYTDGTPALEFRAGSTASGGFNSFIGVNSGGNNTSGSSLTAFGNSALRENTSGFSNTAIGESALRFNTTGHDNIALGTSALRNNTTGASNAAIGNNALNANISGDNNLAFGSNALLSNTNGYSNTAIGAGALAFNIGGAGNSAFGAAALQNNNGNNNIAFGGGSLVSNTSGGANAAFGLNALAANISGFSNVGVGNNAGNSDSDTFATLTNLSNATILGTAAQSLASNSVILGGAGTNAAKVGIGTSSPTNTLSVSPVQYGAGGPAGNGTTASQTGTTVTGTGTTFTSAMVGSEIVFKNGSKATITAFGSATSLTVTPSQTVASQIYRIHYAGLQVTNNGSVGIGTNAPAYQLDVQGGDINTSGVYRAGGTSGSASNCTASQFLINATVSGGIVTNGSCAAAVTSTSFVTVPTSNVGSISGNVLSLFGADVNYAGAVTTTSQTFAGNKTFNGNFTAGGAANTLGVADGTGTSTVNDRLVIASTLGGFAASNRLQMTGNFTSSTTSTQYGIQSSLSFTPNGGSLTNLYGIAAKPTIAASNYAIGQYSAINAGISTDPGYTGQITSGYGLDINSPSIGGTNLITDYRGVSVGGGSSNGGNTSGTIQNALIRADQNTAAAGVGGTLINYGVYTSVGNGNTAGTTNYGLYLTGSGGVSAGGNYAIYSTSNAPNYLKGTLMLGGGAAGYSNAGSYALQVAGDVNLTTGSVFRVNGTAGATTTCSGGQFLQNATTVGGIVTGGSCAAAAGGSGVTTVGTIDSQTKSADGVVISGTNIYMQTADNTKPGLVSTGIQTFAGAKTFSNNVDFNTTTAVSLTLGSGGNTTAITATGVTLSGTSRRATAIRLTAEYAGAVLDPGTASANLGTMTSGIDLTNRINYYKWTTTDPANQSYDIDVQVPIPNNFSAWDTTPVAITDYTSNTTSGTITIEARDSTGTVETGCNFTSVTPGSTSTWATSTNCALAGTYTAGSYMTLRIRLQSPNSGDVRVGNIVLNYKASS